MTKTVKNVLVLGLALGTGLIGCRSGTDLTAVEIGASVTTGAAPLDVSFEAALSTTLDQEDIKLTWDFGDGSGAEGETTSHTFEQPGTYFVTLAAIDDDDDVGADVITITVSDDRTPQVTASSDTMTGEAPLVVSFTANAGGGDGELEYRWDFGDGASSPVPNPTHTYTAAGSFTATVTVTDEDSDEATATVDVMVTAVDTGAPVVMAMATTTTCLLSDGSAVRLDASGTTDPDNDPLTYEWRVVSSPSTDSAEFSSANGVTTDFFPDSSVDGDYEVRLFVSDGKTTVASNTITVVADSRPASIEKLAGDNQTVQAGELLTEPVLISAQNSCGAGVPFNLIGWRGVNMFVLDGQFDTDPAGGGFALAIGGARPGPAMIMVGVGEVVEAFQFTVEAGPVRTLIFDPIAPVMAGSTTGVDVTVRAADVFGNPVSVNGSLELFSEDGSFDEAAGGNNIDLQNGVATTRYLPPSYDGALDIYIEEYSIPSAQETEIRILGRLQGPSSDLESREGWKLFGDWEIGAPDGGPQAVSGSGVLATNLDGDFTPELSSQAGPPAELELSGFFRSNADYVNMSFQQWYDMGPLVGNDAEEVGSVIPLTGGFTRFGEGSVQCTQALGVAYTDGDEESSPGFAGDGFAAVAGSNEEFFFFSEVDLQFFNNGYPGPSLCGSSEESGSFGFGGSTQGQWVDADIFFSRQFSEEGESAVGHNLQVALRSNLAATTAPGWYIDDVQVEGFTDFRAVVEVIPAAAAGVNSDGTSSIFLGQTCGSAGVVGVRTIDGAGSQNRVLQAGLPVEITVSSESVSVVPAVIGIGRGSNFSGEAATATASTDSEGRVSFLVDTNGIAQVDDFVDYSVSLVGGSGDTVSGSLSVFASTNSNNESGDLLCSDGIDNDCDGFTDCDELSCRSAAACVNRACFNNNTFQGESDLERGFHYTWDVDLCSTGANGLSPAGQVDAITETFFGSPGQVWQVCVDGPDGVEVEIGVQGGDADEGNQNDCGRTEGVRLGNECILWPVPSFAEGYAIARTPEASCGEVSVRMYQFDGNGGGPRFEFSDIR
ncbi:MAG: PKD domain-containing protein [Myxococcota bacterium]